MKAWLVYTKEDFNKNKYFAGALISYGSSYGLEIDLVLRESVKLGVKKDTLSIEQKDENRNWHQLEKKDLPKLVINRSRDSFFAKHLELMGIRVYNNYDVTYHCNHKALTHQLVARCGITAMNTFFGDKRYFEAGETTFEYPIVLKSASGHGGNEVFECANLKQLKENLEVLQEDDFLVQELCEASGRDVRVFVLGGKILAAIKREAKEGFKSNYSLGGKASFYILSEKEKEKVNKVIKILPFDFVGIDFMINEKNEFIFNEIEDVVGTRTLYACTNIDAAKCYMQYIASTL